MRRSWMRSMALLPVLVVAPAMAQAAAQLSSVQVHQVTPMQLAPSPVNEEEPAPLQLRLIDGLIAGHTRVEVDLVAEGSRMALLISDRETRLAMTGILPALLQGQLVVEMSRINAQAFGFDLPTGELEPGVAGYLQAVAIEVGGRLRSSAVAPLQICEAGRPCGAVIPGFYSGTAAFAVSPFIAFNRLPPMMSSWAVDIDVTVRSNDWHLSHQITRHGPSGTEIYLILKEPAPGEGQLDVVETHSVQVELGAGNPGRLIVFVGRTEIYEPPPSSLLFRQLQR